MTVDKCLLMFITELKYKQFKTVAQILTDVQSKSIKELVLNLLVGNLDVCNEQRNKLVKYKSFLCKLGRTQTSGKKLIAVHSERVYRILKILKPTLQTFLQNE